MRDAGREQAWIQHFEGAFRSRGATSPKALTPPYVPFQNDDAMLGVLLEARPEVVSFHFGLPREDQLKALHRVGILTLVSVTSAEDGQAALDAGVGGLIAQGIEAGDIAAPSFQKETKGWAPQRCSPSFAPLANGPLSPQAAL